MAASISISDIHCLFCDVNLTLLLPQKSLHPPSSCIPINLNLIQKYQKQNELAEEIHTFVTHKQVLPPNSDPTPCKDRLKGVFHCEPGMLELQPYMYAFRLSGPLDHYFICAHKHKKLGREGGGGGGLDIKQGKYHFKYYLNST